MRRTTKQVRHPFKGASSELVSQRLAEQVGIVTLPGTFFSPPFANPEQDDRYIRFSIANVDEATLRKVPARLEKLNKLWHAL
jgi:aspartate/methionine/tyrosine aminotransferase